MDNFETRAGGDIGLEVRGLSSVIRGYAIVFDRLSEDIGEGLRERIAPSAVDRTLIERPDLRALRDHDTSRLLGRVSANTLRIAKDAHGLLVEIDPELSTELGRETVALIKRRDLTGMSFAFWDLTPLRERFSEHEPNVRVVRDMKIREVSIVTWPAYPDTSVAMRSHREWRSLRPASPASPGNSVTERLAAAARRTWR